MSCQHQAPNGDNWHVDLHFHDLFDDPSAPSRVDHRMLELQLTCKLCGEPMHFLGPDIGVRWDQPTVDLHRTTIHLPFAPGRAPLIGGRMVFQVPPKAKT